MTDSSGHRYFIYLAYDGTNYHGWQIQPNGSSVQETLADALSLVLRYKTEVVGAGRTDAGVHAALMVAHFDWGGVLDTVSLVDKLNRILPPDISVSAIREVRPDAHARFDAVYRTYQYHIVTHKEPFSRHYAWQVFMPLNFERMNEACRILFEYTDFTSFSKLHTDVKTNNCKIMHALWEQTGAYEWTFTIRADRFLRNMVRAVVGTLVDVGRNKLTLDDFRGVIEAKDRCKAGTSVPGKALFLTEISYPDSIFI